MNEIRADIDGLRVGISEGNTPGRRADEVGTPGLGGCVSRCGRKRGEMVLSDEEWVSG